MSTTTFITGIALAGAVAAVAQTNPAPAPQTAPIYRVSVVQRSIKAVNYRYRSGPTLIDFRGTVLLGKGEGTATVESHQGRTSIDAHFKQLSSPQQFGREYLTYVLWAITPEGRPMNLGELIPNHSNKADTQVTTPLGTFALIVTAEPYAAVRQPSDVVVLENQVRPDTEGHIETVNAKYELLPRGEYTWHLSNQLNAELESAPKVSTHEFNTLTELYQAENAVGIAATADAERYAPETYARAQQLLKEAENLHASNAHSNRVIEVARQATETAEDARLIAIQRHEQDQTSARQQNFDNLHQQATTALERAEQLKAEADKEAHAAQVAVTAANDRANQLQQQLESDRQALARAQQEVQAARQQVDQAQQAQTTQGQAQYKQTAAKRVSANRVRLLEDLNGVLPAMDTPRGLVVTVDRSCFDGDSVRPQAMQQIGRVASILGKEPGLRVSVQGYSDTAEKQEQSQDRAMAVRRVLTNRGLPAADVRAEGLGNSRLLGPLGEPGNTRVEIVITGPEVIGTLPFWDHTYSIQASQ